MRPNISPLLLASLLMTLALLLVGSGLNAQNSLNRDLDPVVVVGDSMPKLLGAPVGNLKVLVYEAASGLWHAIPSQVDEVLPNGDYFGDTNGTLDPKDELVFMAQDMGDRAPDDQVWWDDEESKQWPRYEIVVTNPNNQQNAYAYIYRTPTGITGLPTYMRTKADTVYGQSYLMAHHSDNPNFDANGLPIFLGIPVAGLQDSSLNILDRHRLRLRLTAKYSGISLTIDIKEKMDQDIMGVQMKVFQQRPPDVLQGAIRVKRRNVLGISAHGSILGNEINYDDSLKISYTYYPTYSELWSEAREIPAPDPSTVDAKITRMTLSMVLSSNGFGMIYYDKNATGGIRINDADHRYHGFDLGAANWPGKHWCAEVANSDPDWVDPSTHKKAILSKASLFTIFDLRGQPIGEDQALFFYEYDDDDNRRLYGNTGLRMLSNNSSVSGVLDVLVKNYYLAENYNFSQLQELFDEYSVPLTTTSLAQVNDHTPPARINDLKIVARDDTALTLSWTAPADDGQVGRRASHYSIRYSSDAMDKNIEAWWAEATDLLNPPTPSEPGSQEYFAIGNLVRNNKYYFAVRTGDEVINWSAPSNLSTSKTTPVELASFLSFSSENKVSLQWTTASETNNLGFAIERKLENEHDWQEIAFIRGAGTSSTPHQYSYQDALDVIGSVSYRLRQVDTDGAFSYSKVVEVTVQAPSQFLLAQNFPNPFNPSTTVSYQIPASAQGRMSLVIYDMLGRQVRTLFEEPAKAGYYRTEWDGRDDNGLAVSSGIYFYILRSGTFQATRKMIKLE